MRSRLELNLAEHTNLAAGLSATLKRIKAELQAKRSKIADLEKNAFAEEAKDAAQLQRLESALVEHEKRLAEITQRRQAIAAVKEKTFLAQGQAEIEAVKARLAELHRLLEAAQKAEQSTRDALLRFSDEAQQRLAPWPTLVQQVQQQLSYEDASTRILTLAIELHQALIEQGKGADIHPDILRQAGMWGSSLVSEIALEVQNLWPAVTHNGNPESLINQERRLSKLLATYIDVKR